MTMLTPAVSPPAEPQDHWDSGWRPLRAPDRLPQRQNIDMTSGHVACLDNRQVRFSAPHLRHLPAPEPDAMAAPLAEQPLSWI